MAERGVAVLAASASTVGAATVVNAAVVSFIQLFLLLQKQHVEEGDDWVIARVRRLRDRRRAVRLQRRRHSKAGKRVGSEDVLVTDAPMDDRNTVFMLKEYSFSRQAIAVVLPVFQILYEKLLPP